MSRQVCRRCPGWDSASGIQPTASSGRAPPGSRKNWNYRYGPPPSSGTANVPAEGDGPGAYSSTGESTSGSIAGPSPLEPGACPVTSSPSTSIQHLVAVLGDARRGLAAGVDDARDGADDVVLADVHDLDALRGAAVAVDPLGADALHHALAGDQDELLVLADDERAGEAALAVGQRDRLDAHRAAALDGVVVDRGALAEAVLGHDEQVLTGRVRRPSRGRRCPSC